jgi:hypothetical protein
MAYSLTQLQREVLERWMIEAGAFKEIAVREPCGEGCWSAANCQLPTICCALSQRVMAARWGRRKVWRVDAAQLSDWAPFSAIFSTAPPKAPPGVL